MSLTLNESPPTLENNKLHLYIPLQLPTETKEGFVVARIFSLLSSEHTEELNTVSILANQHSSSNDYIN